MDLPRPSVSPSDASAEPSADPQAGSSVGAWQIAAQVAQVGVFLLLLGAFLDVGRTLLLPVVSALVVALMLGPIAGFAARHRVPAWVFALATILFLVAALNAAIILMSAPVIEWIGRAPDIAASIKDRLQIFERPLSALRDVQHALAPGAETPGLKNIDFTALIQPVLAFLSPAIGELVIFFASLFFFLIGRAELRRHLVMLFDGQERRLRALRTLNDIEEDLTRYVATVTAINLGVGIVTAFVTYVIGFPNFGLWGALAFALNFLPYVGPAIMVLVLLVVGLVLFPSFGHAVLAPLSFLALATIEGQFLTPNIIGQRLTLSPLLVFIGLAFWTWLWGPVGAFLATPLLIVGMVAINHAFPESKIELPS